MESFAKTDRDYADGQKNREPIPDEIQTYGFKPPVKMPDGSIELGDYLAANHLNYILNDIYNQLQATGVTERLVTQDSGYRKMSDGRIEMWGIASPNDSGIAAVTYPIQIPDRTMQIFFSFNQVSPSSQVRSAIIAASTVNGFTANATTHNGTDVAAFTGPLAWRAFYDPIKAAE